MKNRTQKNRCSKVPCGKCLKGCKPQYCSNKTNALSKNWCHCNISNKQRKKCKTNIKTKNRKDEIHVSANAMHHKMPYIWRFLDRKTRRKMIKLAQKPVNEINISSSQEIDNYKI